MDYRTIYNKLCVPTDNWRNPSKGEEKHRIVPGCLGGKYEDGNVVLLSFRKHRLAHRLLSRLHPNHLGLKTCWLRMYGHNEQSRLECAIAGGKIQGRNNLESGHWHSVVTRPRTNNPNQGRINATNGHMQKIQKIGASLGGKAVCSNSELQSRKAKKATAPCYNPEFDIKTSWNNKSRINKKYGKELEWIKL